MLDLLTVAFTASMPRIKSAIKRVEVAERNRLRNKAAKSRIRTLMKRCFTLADGVAKGEATAEALQAAVSDAFSKIDKAAGKGIMHKNTAARRKARIAGFVKRTVSPSA